jgi:surface polysaccharide O-acyltransferase-like enzyme
MKRLLLFCFLLICTFVQAQGDTARTVEPGQQTSYTNKDLVLISIAGLALLLAIYFLFRRLRGTRN